MRRAAPQSAWLERYGRAWEELSPETISNVIALAHRDITFTDPFNTLSGHARFEELLQATFKHLEAPRFEVFDRAISANAGYLRWRMTARAKTGGIELSIHGMSEVHFDEAGLVIDHIDHWDAAGQFYEKLPLLGRLLAMLRRKLSV